MPADGLPTPRRYRAIAAISLGTSLAVLDGGIVYVALPSIASDLGIASSSAILLVTLYQLALLTTLLPFSALGDRIGHLRLYRGGQVAFLVATTFCVLADSFPLLLAARALQALGVSATLSVSVALLRATYPRAGLGRGLGINSIIIGGSAALAPTLGGFLVSTVSWQWVFVAGAPFALLSLLLGRALPALPPPSSTFNLGAAILCAASFALMFATLETAIHLAAPLLSVALLALASIVVTVFVRLELREARPILPIDLLKRPVFALASTAALTGFLGSIMSMLALPFLLQQEFGFRPHEIGTILLPWPLTMMVVAPLAGNLSDKLPNGVMGAGGMAVAALGILMLASLPPDPTYGDLLWRVALCGAGFGLFIPSNARLMIGSAPMHRSSSAGALMSTTRLTGQTLGATLLAGLLALGLSAGTAPLLVAAACVTFSGLCSLTHLMPSIRAQASARIS